VQLAEPSADEQFAAAFRDWDPAFDVDTLSTAEAAARLRSRPPAMRAEVIAALDEWASERRRQRAPRARWRRVADLTAALDDEPRPNRVELRQMLARGKLERERDLAALAMALRPVPVPFDAGLGRDRQRLRRLVEGTDVAAEPVLGLLTLARALQAAGDDLLAERLLGAAVQARPHEVAMQHALGRLRSGQGRWREAVECHVAAGALRPELGVALAEALLKCGQVGEGLALFDYLITAGRPDDPWLHAVHGLALDNVARWDKEAEAAYRQAMRLRGLRLGLAAEGRYKEAEAAYRQAMRLRRDYIEAHGNLGAALNEQGWHKGAEAAYRQAIRLRPDFPEAHWNLGNALDRQGKSEEAEAAYRQAIRLKPDFYADAFAAEPKLADDLRAYHRYNVACCAALAAAARDADGPRPDTRERARLRGQALGWLRADLAAWAKATDRALVRRTLAHWQQDADLAGVRDKEGLAALPAGERAEWEKLWAEVADLLRRLDAAKAGAGSAGK
jgi:tetratricopeptide (TPR) repeat protein